MSKMPMTLVLEDNDGTVCGRWSTDFTVDRKFVFEPLLKNLPEIALQNFAIDSLTRVLEKYEDKRP